MREFSNVRGPIGSQQRANQIAPHLSPAKSMEDVFGPDGLIARHHPNYEYRPGQIEMAAAVHQTIEKGGLTLIEAGTGTGKTLAYLIPALAAGRRVIVSTATKALQEQLHKKDIPFLQRIIPREFTAICMKGRSNYVCLNRLKKAEVMPVLRGLEEVDHFEEIRKWAAETETGDRAELTNLPEDLSFWPQIDARAEICLGQKCPEYDACFITQMRRKAFESDVVIVNHHLFFADLALRGGEYGAVLPDYDTVIFDEAHELEDVAASYFGCSVSNFRFVDLIQDTQKITINEVEKAAELTKALARLSQRSDTFFLGFRGSGSDQNANSGRSFGQRNRGSGSDGRYPISRAMFASAGSDGKLALTAKGETFLSLLKALDRVLSAANTITDGPIELENIIRRTEELKFELEFVVMDEDPTFVRWCEQRGRGVFLHATPIDVSGILSEKLFAEVKSAVLTSATMTAGRSFGFLKSRLGIEHSRDFLIDSHFDFKSQAVLYLPERMPDPRSSEFLERSVEEIVRIVKATSGRAFILFTSNSSMTETYERARNLIDFPLFMQGQASKTGLLDRFRTTKGAVLFATSSFWQGVDVQGEALSCVVIVKLPFAVPSDPVTAARQKYIDDQGGNSFYEYSVPEAVISLKQGLGRLIRSTSDRGILSILDPRLRTKAYGRYFLQSLPHCKVTASLEEAAAVLR